MVSLASPQGTYEPGKRHWLKVKKDYLNEGAMADTADLVVLGAFYGQGSKGQGGLRPVGWHLFEGRGWPFYWLDLPVRLVMTSKVLGSGAPNWPMSPQTAISESYRLRQGKVRQEYPVLV